MTLPPLIYRPSNAGKKLTVKRLAVDRLFADARAHRFLVTTVLHDDDLLAVATPDLICARILAGPRTRHDDQPSWSGDTPSHKGSDREDGSWTQPFRGRDWFAPLLRPKEAFLATIGPEVDLMVQRSGDPVVRRVTVKELRIELDRHRLRR